jgi:hypothetical protein
MSHSIQNHFTNQTNLQSMHTSESIANIAKALITFHVKVDTIKKDATNPFFKSTYASLSNILESINDPLIEAGLSISQFPDGENGLITLLMHGESGEWIQSKYEMRPVKDDPQGRGQVITYQRRYALSSILMLQIDEKMADDDGNSGSYIGNPNIKQTETKPSDPNALQPAQEQPKAWLNNDDDEKKPWLNENTDAFKRAKAKIASGELTIEKVRMHYKVSKKIETALKSNS